MVPGHSSLHVFWSLSRVLTVHGSSALSPAQPGDLSFALRTLPPWEKLITFPRLCYTQLQRFDDFQPLESMELKFI